MANKLALIDLIQQGQEEMHHFAAVMTEEERARRGTLEHWAPKDTMAHLAEWKKRMAIYVTAARAGTTPPDFSDSISANDAIFEEYRNRPWEEILAVLDSAHSEMLIGVQTLTEEELNDAEWYPWLEGRPLWRSIAGNGFLHPISHLGAYYIERGDRDYANQLRESEARWVAAVDDSANWQGIALYTLACHYALMGEKEKALEKLEPSLSLYPYLIEWSKQDTDLTSLHEDPAFRALVERLSAKYRHVNPSLDRQRLVDTMALVLDQFGRYDVKVEYRLVGTGAALLRGVPIPAGDIDLLVKERPSVDAIATPLMNFKCITPPTYLTDERQYFVEYEVNGVEVGISTVEWETDSDGIECIGSGPWLHYDLLECGAYTVPTVALELRLVSELVRGRDERSEPLLQFMKDKGCDIELVKQGMQARGLPDSTQKQVIERLQP
jgi:hypothetical protein